MVIRVTALTGGDNQPSSRYRVRQHIRRLSDLGIDVCDRRPNIDRHAELLPPRLNAIRALRWPTKILSHGVKAGLRAPDAYATWRTDLTWLQRELVPGMPSWEPLMKRPLVLDVDDAIWLSPPVGKFMAKTLARHADVVVAGNRYLAEWFEPYAREVVILPTAVDTEVYQPRDTRPKDDFVIGWMGTSSNFGFVKDIEPALQQILQNAPHARIVIVSNVAPKFETLPSNRVRFIKWTAGGEAEALRTFDVGLMPLADEPWTRGKCSFKMLQYMACAVPVVVSPVGMNADVLQMADLGMAARRTSDWVDALLSIYKDRALGDRLGSNGRAVAEAHFSSEVVAVAISELFKTLGAR